MMGALKITDEVEVSEEEIASISYREELKHDLEIKNNIDSTELTVFGKAISSLPIEPSISRMLLWGCALGYAEETATIAALLSIQNPYSNKKASDSVELHTRKRYDSSHGDAFTLYKLFLEWGISKKKYSWSKRHGVQHQKMKEALQLRNQFLEILSSNNLHKRVNRELPVKRKRAGLQDKDERKILKLEEGVGFSDDEAITDPDEEEKYIDHRSELIVNDVNSLNTEDIIVLKFIIAAGLCPNYAVADSG